MRVIFLDDLAFQVDLYEFLCLTHFVNNVERRSTNFFTPACVKPLSISEREYMHYIAICRLVVRRNSASDIQPTCKVQHTYQTKGPQD